MPATTDLTELATSLETAPELIPHLPYLLQDIGELGGMFHHALPTLRQLPLSSKSQVLDLGCGKGEIACTLAREFNCHVHGIDWFQPFIEDARGRAKQYGVNERCSFQCADARQAIERGLLCDLLVMFSVERFFGKLLNENIISARKLVRPGGFMVIEEMFLLPGVQPAAEHGNFADESTTRAMMLSSDDRMIAWIPSPQDEFAAWNNWAVAAIHRRVQELTILHTEIAEPLRSYAEFQENESRRLERHFSTVTAIIQCI